MHTTHQTGADVCIDQTPAPPYGQPMTLRDLVTTHGHTWLIHDQPLPTAVRRHPLITGTLTVHDLTLTAPDPETLAATLAALDTGTTPGPAPGTPTASVTRAATPR